jgi:hypothetical protein
MSKADTGSSQGGSQGAAGPQQGGQSGQPAPGQPARQQPTENPRATGHSPARDARQAAAGGKQQGEQTVKIGDQEYAAETVREAIARKVETDLRRSSLPKDPNGYEIKLPENFKPPEGMQFQFDANDPALAEFRRIAHARGLDPAVFQEALGAYASTEIRKLEQTNRLITANREKLGSAVDARLTAVEQWMTAIAGDKAKPMMTALKQYPMVETVEALETIIRKFSSQGGADFDQRHRAEQDRGEIPGYDNMSFEQRRMHQMQQQEQRRAAQAAARGSKR